MLPVPTPLLTILRHHIFPGRITSTCGSMFFFFAVPFDLLKVFLSVFLVLSLLVWRAANVLDWVRATWILRKLPRPSGDPVFGGVLRLLTGKRLRVMQAVNDSVVNGSGVFYYNILGPCMQFHALDKRLAAGFCMLCAAPSKV